MEYETPDASQDDLAQLKDRVLDDLHQLSDAARRRSSEMIASGRDYVKEHPLAAMGLAFATGFILAGGLISRTTLRALGWGGRFWLRRYVGDLLGREVERLLGRSTAIPSPTTH